MTTYNIYWSLTPTVSKSSNKIASVTSPYNHTGLSIGTAYYYAVTANKAGGESALSAVVTATPQSDVTIASTVWGHDGEFTINGADNAGVSRYSISTPRGIAPDGSGGFYVADSGNHRRAGGRFRCWSGQQWRGVRVRVWHGPETGIRGKKRKLPERT